MSYLSNDCVIFFRKLHAATTRFRAIRYLGEIGIFEHFHPNAVNHVNLSSISFNQ